MIDEISSITGQDHHTIRQAMNSLIVDGNYQILEMAQRYLGNDQPQSTLPLYRTLDEALIARNDRFSVPMSFVWDEKDWYDEEPDMDVAIYRCYPTCGELRGEELYIIGQDYHDHGCDPYDIKICSVVAPVYGDVRQTIMMRYSCNRTTDWDWATDWSWAGDRRPSEQYIVFPFLEWYEDNHYHCGERLRIADIPRGSTFRGYMRSV